MKVESIAFNKVESVAEQQSAQTMAAKPALDQLKIKHRDSNPFSVASYVEEENHETDSVL